MKARHLQMIVVLALLGACTAGARPAAEAGFDDPGRLARLVREGKPEYVLVDVRTPAEYASGHIPTAVNIPVDEIRSRPPAGKKDALIIVYCRSGNRSATARATLEALGYTDVVDFGAVTRWEGGLVTE